MGLHEQPHVKLEYLYYDLGAVRVNNSNIGALYYTTILGGLAIDNATAASTQYNGHIVRAGLNYRFDAVRERDRFPSDAAFHGPETPARAAHSFRRLALLLQSLQLGRELQWRDDGGGS